MKQSDSPESKSRQKLTLTDFLRARTAFVVDPIVTFLARYRFSPDVLTVVGMVSHFLFAWLIAIGQMRWAAVAILLISPLDALDGALARKLGRKQSGFGAFLDSTLDRLSEVILFSGFIFFYMRQVDELMLVMTYVAVTGSILVSYARARAEALGLTCRVGILTRVERYMVLMFFLALNLPYVALVVLALFTYVTVVQRMFHVWQQTVGRAKKESRSLEEHHAQS